jgi:hypothetical protein
VVLLNHAACAPCCFGHPLFAGSRQLFLGDVQSGIKKFGALFFFLANVSL